MKDNKEYKAADASMKETDKRTGDNGNVENVRDSSCVGRHMGFVLH